MGLVLLGVDKRCDLALFVSHFSLQSGYSFWVRRRGPNKPGVLFTPSRFFVWDFERGRSCTPTPQQPKTADPGFAPVAQGHWTKEVMDKVYLSDVSEKDKPWDTHRAQSDQVRDLYQDVGYERYAERIRECAQRLLFALSATDEGERRLRLQSAQFCRVRHCPACQWRRSLTWVARFHKALPAILGDYPTAKFVLLTLTVKNCPTTELRATLARMNQAFKRLTLRKEWPALGYVKSVEVTPGRRRENSPVLDQKVAMQRGTPPLLDSSDRLGHSSLSASPQQPDQTIYNFSYCHPHFHVLLMVPSGYFAGKNYIKQDRWVQLWRECLQVNYDPVVDVRKVGGRKRKPSPEDPQLALTALIAGIKETIKYAVKPEHLVLNAGFLEEITKQLHKTRSISVGGVIRKYISESEPEDDELIHGDDLIDESQDSDPKWLFNWGEQEKRYKGGPIA